VAPQVSSELLRAARLVEVNQWVVKAGFDEVAATFGLYRPDDDLAREEGLILLNWFCVSPRFRGQGLGRRLWDETVAHALALGMRRLVFYSSNEPEHQAAERLYVAGGCARRLGPPLRDCDDRLTFFDRALGETPAASPVLRAEIDAMLQRYYAIDGDPALAAMAPAAASAGCLSVAA
jgi:GNAT superfamily N-acetyltransferase